MSEPRKSPMASLLLTRPRPNCAAANQRVEQELGQARNETASRLADADRRAQAIIEEAKARATEEGNKIVAAAQRRSSAASHCSP